LIPNKPHFSQYAIKEARKARIHAAFLAFILYHLLNLDAGFRAYYDHFLHALYYNVTGVSILTAPSVSGNHSQLRGKYHLKQN